MMADIDYRAISKDIYERFHDAFHKLHVSELKEQLAEKDEIITALNHTIADLKHRVDLAEWLVEKYREENE